MIRPNSRRYGSNSRDTGFYHCLFKSRDSIHYYGEFKVHHTIIVIITTFVYGISRNNKSMTSRILYRIYFQCIPLRERVGELCTDISPLFQELDRNKPSVRMRPTVTVLSLCVCVCVCYHEINSYANVYGTNEVSIGRK